jgi:hypothetical protein
MNPHPARPDGPGASRGPTATDTALDEAYEILAAAAVESDGGFVNHGPMACEALVALGQDEQVLTWAKRAATRPAPAGGGGHRLPAEDWRDALGRSELLGDWVALFHAEIDHEGWQAVLQRWLPRLMPALGSKLFHTTIRVAHAARANAERNTGPRQAELARALGYWASRYGSGTIQLPVIGTPHLVEPNGSNPERRVLVVAQSAAERYVAKPNIVTLHGVTGAMAVHLLLPYLRPADRPYAAAQLKAVEMAIGERPVPSPTPSSQARELGPMIVRATDSMDPHQVKLVEACVRGHAASSAQVFLDAAALVTASAT